VGITYGTSYQIRNIKHVHIFHIQFYLRVSYTISSKLSNISFSVDVPELSLSAILNIVEMSSWKKIEAKQ
jgi:hypothetical protein